MGLHLTQQYSNIKIRVFEQPEHTVTIQQCYLTAGVIECIVNPHEVHVPRMYL